MRTKNKPLFGDTKKLFTKTLYKRSTQESVSAQIDNNSRYINPNVKVKNLLNQTCRANTTIAIYKDEGGTKRELNSPIKFLKTDLSTIQAHTTGISTI